MPPLIISSRQENSSNSPATAIKSTSNGPLTHETYWDWTVTSSPVTNIDLVSSDNYWAESISHVEDSDANDANYHLEEDSKRANEARIMKSDQVNYWNEVSYDKPTASDSYWCY
jgi:hypothetical protein